MPTRQTNIIYPVILEVSLKNRKLTGREQVAFLQKHARQAVAVSARRGSVDLPAFEKDSRGAPLPETASSGPSPINRNMWPVWWRKRRPGLILKKIRPVRAGLFERITDESERQLGPLSDEFFYRFWTAKEAVLKATRMGLAGLSRCKIIRILDADVLEVAIDGIKWRVTHRIYDHHLISVTSDDHAIDWCFPS
ncbi:MAG: 4'-phosphopantetheinyl transferase superfamily protein [Desulfobacterales bacterium]